MKKILVLMLFFVLFLVSCDNGGAFISDEDLEYYGLTDIKAFVPSNKFYTSKYVDNIYVFMDIKDNIDCVNFNKKVYDLLSSNDNISYFGYILEDNTTNNGETLVVYESNNIIDYYHTKPLSYDAGKVNFSSCRFFYLQKDDDTLYEIHINSYSLPRYINSKDYNMSIYLSTYNDYVLN